MKSYCYRLLMHIPLMVYCFLVFATGAVSQVFRYVELDFGTTDSINVEVGTQVCFNLVIRDTNGNIMTNWDSVGQDITLHVPNSTAETDTNMASWNSSPDAFTWLAILHNGVILTRTGPQDFLIGPAAFVNGVMHVCFISTKAEVGIRIEVEPYYSAILSRSPPITFTPAALDNFLVELTNQTGGPNWNDHYAHRPFEFLVVPRDRFLNHTTTQTPMRIDVRYPSELQLVTHEMPYWTFPLLDPFDPSLTVQGVQNFFLVPNTERAVAQGDGHWIRAYLPSDSTILGISDPFFVIPHAPFPFALDVPADQTSLTLQDATQWVEFRWEKPRPSDPFDGYISRFDPALHEDSTHYTIHFTDLAQTQDITFDSFDAGQSPSFGIRQTDLAAVVDQLAGTTHTTNYTLLWYVNASDGDYTTRSDPGSPNIPGNRLSITNTLFTGKGVGVNFAVQNPVILPASGAVSFELQAMENGSTINDWDSSGSDVTLMVKGTTVDTDTSTRSWNGDPDAYSWCRLTVDGQDITPSAPHQYTIAKSLFKQGRASVSYTSTKAESGVTIEIQPSVPGIEQSSPELSWDADTLENFLVEITWPDSITPGVYIKRPFELIVTPRDRFLNTIDSDVLTWISTGPPGVIDSVPGMGPSPPWGIRTLNGMETFWLQGLVERDIREGKGVTIDVSSSDNWRLRASSTEFSILPHAPYPFGLLSPTDSTTWPLWVASWQRTFTWDQPDPVEPYTNILLSRFSDEHASDDVRYTVRFRDFIRQTRETSFVADDGGRLPRLTITEGQLAGIIDDFAGTDTAIYRDVLWFVEATDSLYVTTSTHMLPTLPGNRLRLFKESTADAVDEPVPSVIYLAQNYPNPFNPATTIHYSTTKRAHVSLKVFDLLGSEVATLHDGMLDAG
ncbi:MAG: hypothetical protein IH600_16405, partial [Bacteroidetes bacterium]|nr:hypothetical protein [Bacteroidota bacterium]